MAQLNLDTQFALKKLFDGGDTGGVTGLQLYGEDWRDHRLGPHVPFAMYRSAAANTPKKWLYFWVNPSECQWSVGTRTSIEKVSGGAIHHEWPSTGIGEQPATRFDQPVIRFAFQSGIITPHGYQDVSRPTHNHLPPGIGNFYDFLTLLDQPNCYNDAAGNSNTNYVNIYYFSSTMPRILLKGFFTSEGVSWTDSADNPYTTNGWGASFEVFSTTPSLSSSGLQSAFMQFGFN